MDKLIELVGAGGGGGVLGTLFALFGIRRRVDELENKAMTKELCVANRKTVQSLLDVHTKSFEYLVKKIDNIDTKIDNLK